VFRSSGLQLVTTSVIVGETYTLLNDRHGYSVAMRWTEAQRTGALTDVIHLDETEELSIWATLRAFGGVPLSYQDASLIVLGKKLGIRSVFTFDSDFRQAGLNVVP